MRGYLTLMQCYRRRMGAPDAETVLRKVAGGMVIATSGGSDWLWPTTVAIPEDGGYRVTGRKAFCSQAPWATVVAACVVLPDQSGRHFPPAEPRGDLVVRRKGRVG